jgi:alkanesulfonate monooxygenase SsuD/methylene tetrahydromethanopterin reductase-like flavin-dependent oxidoreductase (luciferase family)
MAQRAEEIGFDSVWVLDHLLLPIDQWIAGTDPLGAWEGWSVLTAVAASTSRVEIGSLVLCTGFRNPALIAKMADTVDEISGGRLILGLGAGSMADEFARFGFAADERVSRFEEAVQIITGLLREGEVNFAGRFYQAQTCVLRPRGPRSSGPPVLIGARQERMFRIAARYADLWNNAWPSRAESVQPTLDNINAACREVGRDPGSLIGTVGVMIDIEDANPNRDWIWSQLLRKQIEPLAGTSEEIAEALRAFGRLGVAHVQVWLNPATIEGIEGFAPVLAHLEQTM